MPHIRPPLVGSPSKGLQIKGMMVPTYKLSVFNDPFDSLHLQRKTSENGLRESAG